MNPRDHEPLEPLKVWTEYRWIFVRRMAGDELCQKAFYKLCTLIWLADGIVMGEPLRRYQDALIETVFQYKNKVNFLKLEKSRQKFLPGMAGIVGIYHTATSTRWSKKLICLDHWLLCMEEILSKNLFVQTEGIFFGMEI